MCGEDTYAGVLSVCLLVVGFLGAAACTFLIHHLKGHEPLTPEDLALTQNPIVHEGSRLHEAVEQHMWCVTLDDLKQFRRLVLHAIVTGMIKPTDQDPFDATDTRIGPSVYTVNTQYIKPVTAAAGNPSWALMIHPQGLKCDLFITHGWAEGIFEFLDQVTSSWPYGAKAAYVCFLSNPQNLDIGGMIASPEESPFARALASATQVLAAPNHKLSIYTRAWCVFEAYLAYSWGKAIFTARALPPQCWSRTLRASSWSIMMLGICFCTMMLGNRDWALFSGDLVFLANIVFASLAFLLGISFLYLMTTGRYEWKTTEVAVFACSTFVAAYLATNTFQLSFRRPSNFVPVCLAPLCAWAMEYDRLLGAETAKQTRYLRAGFTGKIRNAMTSNPADLESIRNSIEASGTEAAVDEAVAVLLRMNISTPELCLATARAGELGNASNWSRGLFAISLVFWITQAFNTALWRTEPGFAWIPPVAAAEALVAGIGFQLMPRDRMAFAQRSQAFLLLVAPKWIPGVPFGGKWGDVIVNGVVCPFVILVAFAGPSCTARVPVLGPMIVRLLFGRNPFQYSRRGPADPVRKQSAENGSASLSSATALAEIDDFVSI